MVAAPKFEAEIDRIKGLWWLRLLEDGQIIAAHPFQNEHEAKLAYRRTIAQQVPE